MDMTCYLIESTLKKWINNSASGNQVNLPLGLWVADSIGLPLVLDFSQITMLLSKLRKKKEEEEKKKLHLSIIYELLTCWRSSRGKKYRALRMISDYVKRKKKKKLPEMWVARWLWDAPTWLTKEITSNCEFWCNNTNNCWICSCMIGNVTNGDFKFWNLISSMTFNNKFSCSELETRRKIM
jgi:hypothetical protein